MSKRSARYEDFKEQLLQDDEVRQEYEAFLKGRISPSVKWEEVREEILSSMEVEIASIQTKNYSEVIEVRVPVRFYWYEDEFDGIEMGPFTAELLPWQEEMMNRCLGAIGGDEDD